MYTTIIVFTRKDGTISRINLLNKGHGKLNHHNHQHYSNTRN